MKRLMIIFLLLTICAACIGCTINPPEPPTEPTASEAPSTTSEPASEPSEDEPSDPCTPVLYRAESEDGGVLYLFGSIHVTDSRAYPLPDYVMDAYAESDYLAVECDIYDMEQQMDVLQSLAEQMILTDGSTARDHLGDEVYEAAKDFLTERDAYFSLYDQYVPAMWQSLIDSEVMAMTGLDAQSGIDMFFLEQAHTSGKEIREVESVEFQYNLLLSFSDEFYAYLIGTTVNTASLSSRMTMALYEKWLEGDEDALGALLANESGAIPPELTEEYEEYTERMITERNAGMADTAEQYLKEDKTGFFVVGAAHILGEGGCASILRERGYQVERID